MLRELIHRYLVWRERRAILALTLRLTGLVGFLCTPAAAAEILVECREKAESAVNRRLGAPASLLDEES